MKALILAAGTGSRLMPLTKNRPKCLLKIAGKEMLAHQLDILDKEGIKNIVIVVGHKAAQVKKFISSYKAVKNLKIRIIENKKYVSTGSAYSMWLAGKEIKKGFLHINADLLFHSKLLNKLLKCGYKNAIIIDKNVKLRSDMVKVITKKNRVVEMSRERKSKKYAGEAVGPVKFSADGAKKILSMTEKVIKKGDRKKAVYFLMHDFAEKHELYAIDSDKLPWFEIDTMDELKKTEEEIKKAIIFDFDGVVINSEPARYRTYRQLFMKEFSVNLPEKMESKLFGRKQKENMTYFIKKYKLRGNIGNLIKKRKRLLDKEFSKKRNLKPVDGLLPFLKRLKENKFKTAIASSSSKGYIKKILSKMRISNFFDVVISGDMIKKSKPNPEMFIKAAKMIKAKKENCLVIEDSTAGIIAAKRAKMSVIAVTSSFNKRQLKKADKVVNNLSEIETSDLIRIFN